MAPRPAAYLYPSKPAAVLRRTGRRAGRSAWYGESWIAWIPVSRRC